MMINISHRLAKYKQIDNEFAINKKITTRVLTKHWSPQKGKYVDFVQAKITATDKNVMQKVKRYRIQSTQ